MEGEQSFEGESEYISQKPKRMVFAGVQKHGRIKNKTLRPYASVCIKECYFIGEKNV